MWITLSRMLQVISGLVRLSIGSGSEWTELSTSQPQAGPSVSMVGESQGDLLRD